jgi:hypothetical protein
MCVQVILMIVNLWKKHSLFTCYLLCILSISLQSHTCEGGAGEAVRRAAESSAHLHMGAVVVLIQQ